MTISEKSGSDNCATMKESLPKAKAQQPYHQEGLSLLIINPLITKAISKTAMINGKLCFAQIRNKIKSPVRIDSPRKPNSGFEKDLGIDIVGSEMIFLGAGGSLNEKPPMTDSRPLGGSAMVRAEGFSLGSMEKESPLKVESLLLREAEREDETTFDGSSLDGARKDFLSIVGRDGEKGVEPEDLGAEDPRPQSTSIKSMVIDLDGEDRLLESLEKLLFRDSIPFIGTLKELVLIWRASNFLVLCLVFLAVSRDISIKRMRAVAACTI